MSTTLSHPASDALALQLLRDELRIDAAIADPAGAREMLTHLSLITTAGFLGTGLLLAASGTPTLGLQGAIHYGAATATACTLGFFAAIGAGLPSYWFYGVVADIQAPAWRLAVELVRVQAIGAVTLLGVLPFWLATYLALYAGGADLFQDPVWRHLTALLPFLAALPGVLGLRRAFCRMRAQNGVEGGVAPTLLTLWWIVLFQFTAPATILALFGALYA